MALRNGQQKPTADQRTDACVEQDVGHCDARSADAGDDHLDAGELGLVLLHPAFIEPRRSATVDVQRALGLRLGVELVDREPVHSGEMHAEQARVRPLPDRQDMVLGAGRSEQPMPVQTSLLYRL